MHPLTLLAALAAVYVPTLAVPGPNFLAVTRAALAAPRRISVATALGVATGSTVQAAFAAAGVGVLLAHHPAAQRAVALVGGFYLVVVARSIWRQARMNMLATEAGAAEPTSISAAYRAGLLTNLTNPKALVFFSTIFTALVGPGVPWTLRVAAVAAICVLSISWHLALATLFTHRRVRHAYAGVRPALLRLTAVAIGGFGLHLAWGAMRG